MANAPRVSVEEVKRRMDEGEEMVILDVRRGSWNRSDVKLRGAIRMEPREAYEGDGQLSRDVKIVTYCT